MKAGLSEADLCKQVAATLYLRARSAKSLEERNALIDGAVLWTERAMDAESADATRSA